ncbi:glycosyltransferase [Streptomyces sp. NRRL F-2747]|uniref:glycosyltransferase n=1 Tax=Streptomyces sp. NRRL F-2747 TaxID=1463843 RepID=UPI0004C61FF3
MAIATVPSAGAWRMALTSRLDSTRVIHAGLLAARAELVCFCDRDASMDPGPLAPMAERVAAGEADLLLGRRRPQDLHSGPCAAAP